MLPQEIIRKTRNKIKLSKEEIDFFIKGISNNNVADIQVASFTMAILLNGLSKEEILNLTLSMRDSGDKLNWKSLSDYPIVDKHSTGGVGDKVSLMLAPMLASLGAKVPMIAGRGLGHTGGTLDKLDALTGYKTNVSNELFVKTVTDVGCAIIGQTSKLAPADKKIYAIRDVCATVESIPLITASILSKKLAAGLEYLVMDIKCGNGAFMTDINEATELAQSIVDVANGAGTKTSALITDMSSVLGKTVGNNLELKESIAYLKGEKVDNRLDEVTISLCSEILINCGICKTNDEAKEKLYKSITSGLAYEKFAKMSASLGADTNILDNYEKNAPVAKHVKPIFANKAGFITNIDTRKIGLGLIMLGGGRTIPNQEINYTTGFSEFCQIGDKVDNNSLICYLHSEDENNIDEVTKFILSAITISDEKPLNQNTIIKRIS